MSHIADNFGRKKTEFVSWGTGIFGLLLLVLSQKSLWLVAIGSFFMGLGVNSAITLHYTLIKELLVGKMRERSYLILQVMFSIGVSLIALLSMYILDWKLIAGFFLLIPAILMVPYSLYIVEETPNFSLKKSKPILLASLNRIARMNGED
jgi:MFS family permease